MVRIKKPMGSQDATDADDFLPPPKRIAEPSATTEKSTTESSATSDGDDSESDIVEGINEIMNPFTGEIIRLDDIDGLIGLYEGLDKVNKQAYAVMLRIRESLAARTEGDAKTRRIRGETRLAKLEWPAESFTQADLKRLWEEFPDVRDDYLKIDTIGVKHREYAKIANTSGGERFTEFRDGLTKASRGITGTPTLKIEV